MSFQILESFDSYVDANLMLGRMQAEGIRCWLKDEYTVTIDPILSNAIGGIKLMVDETDIDRAIEIYQLMEQKKRETFACPTCKSHQIELITSTRKPLNWIAAIGTWLLGNYAMGAGKIWHCYNCDAEFDKPYEVPSPDSEDLL